jgi:hypothetical protein
MRKRKGRNGGFRRIHVGKRRIVLCTMPGMDRMHQRWLGIVATALLVAATLPTRLVAQTERGPYARIAVLRPHDGDTVDFEAGYIRHLEWHRQAKDTWGWYGWTVWAGERQRWFVYATFGHTAAELDHPVPPAEDERDNISNVTPHAQFVGNALFEYLPGLSRGTANDLDGGRSAGTPTPTARLELTTVDLNPGAAADFEAALTAEQATLRGETLWYRMVAGGTAPRYVRLRPRASLAALLDGRSDQSLVADEARLIARTTVEILSLRPAMSYGVAPSLP